MAMSRILCFCLVFGSSGSDYNIVSLDNATFPLLVGQSLAVFLRFDREYAYGDKAEAFKATAAVLAKAESPILVANIGISTYGEKLNQDMARKFNFIPKDQELQSEDMDTWYGNIFESLFVHLWFFMWLFWFFSYMFSCQFQEFCLSRPPQVCFAFGKPYTSLWILKTQGSNKLTCHKTVQKHIFT